jgi:hypothetical protein
LNALPTGFTSEPVGSSIRGQRPRGLVISDGHPQGASGSDDHLAEVSAKAEDGFAHLFGTETIVVQTGEEVIYRRLARHP